jgi:hypothetical protein
MSEFQRREFLTGAAAFAAGVTVALTSTRRAEAGDPSFMNNVPDSLFSGKELPKFKFALEKSKGRVEGGSTVYPHRRPSAPFPNRPGNMPTEPSTSWPKRWTRASMI